MSNEVTLNATQNYDLQLPCGKCHSSTYHKVIQSVEVKNTSLFYITQESYQTVQCLGCRGFSFRKTFTSSLEDTELVGQKFPKIHEELYPSRVAGRHRLEKAELLPEELSRIYSETHAALCNKQPVLAGIGIRALIETVCKEKESVGANLERKIDGLIAMGILTTDGAEILHGLRILGNEAAHEVKPHAEKTLGAAMEVVEHLLKGVYILPAIAKKLPKRTKSGTP